MATDKRTRLELLTESLKNNPIHIRPSQGFVLSMQKAGRAIRNLGESASHAADAMQYALTSYQRQHIADLEYGFALLAYKRHHKTLPGSERTSRLRKKRRTKVVRWYRKNRFPVKLTSHKCLTHKLQSN